MSPEEFDAMCAQFNAQLRTDAEFSRYLDERSAAERRRLGLPDTERKLA